MMVAVLFLSLFLLGNNILLALLWRQNQDLHGKLLRVTAKATQPHAVVQEVAPSPPRKTEQQEEREERVRQQNRVLWRA